MQPYSEFAPTSFDPVGAFLDDRQDWLVCPVSITRDSPEGDYPYSNYQVFLRELGKIDPDGETWEEHSFNHWGPGWFNIIIVKPDTPAAEWAQEAENTLEDYPVLDDDDYSQREWEAMCEAWEGMSMDDRIEVCHRSHGSIFAARRDELPQDWRHNDALLRWVR